MGLSLEPVPRLATVQRPSLLRFLRLLPATSAEVESAIGRALAENPALERRPGVACQSCGQYCWSDRCRACSAAPIAHEPTAVVDWRAELVLEAQLELPTSMHEDVAATVEALNHHGLLEERPAVGDDALAAVVAVLRDIGPPGIAATSPVECVRLQAQRLVATGQAPEIVLALLGPGLDPLTRGGPAEAAHFLHVSEADVREAVEVLRTSTRPYASVDTGQGHPLAFADVVFRLVEPEGTLDISVPDAAWLGLSLAPQDAGLDRDARAWWAPHRTAAAQLIASIDARATMLSRVASVLAERQRGFVLSGAVGHRPLRRSDVATELEVHPSTVGRAVQDKVARCPDGRVVPLEAFFGAATSIRHRVAEVAAAHPEASDADLARELERRGVLLARRTVAKYRASLGSG